jgi:preprotein translocase subunit SecA
MKKFISEIKKKANDLSERTEEELNFEIEKIKKKSKIESLDNLLIEWFAIVQEVSFRQIGLKHFDTQLLAGFFLHQGNIVEMKTGEGKTLASTLPISLNALSKKGVHVVTVNDYLAERDQKWMGKIYSSLGLTSGLIKSNMGPEEKKRKYNSDITYLTNSELVFDFLRDSSAQYKTEMVQRPFHYCILDEIDSIFIDEARTPLILSTFEGNTKINKLYLAKGVANRLEKEKDFQVDEKRKEIQLTDRGYNKVTEILGLKSLYDPEDPWILQILNALKAQYIFKLNKDYIVLNNKVMIVDEFTGRIMEDRRWSLGIHEAIEIKEKVEIGGGTKTKSSITYQNFFPLYPKLAGMTGTAKTTEKEFQEIYNLNVVVIPTEKPLARKDLSDLVYQTELAKWKSVFNQAKECFTKGQPLLIGTSSVEKSEFLSDLFELSKLPHQVLNAKPENVTRESEIIAQAGKRGSITIATNMAGRGTDIILGGNPKFEVKQKLSELILEKKSGEKSEEIQALFEEYSDFSLLENHIQTLPFSLENCFSSLKNLYDSFYKEMYPQWKKENEIVKELGGLFVLGTERHETRRIDDQLRGRAGRQGDPGVSQFVVSLEDDLLKIFAGDSLKGWMSYLMEEKDSPLESGFLTKTLEKAQKKVELYNYELRKNVFEYDEILNNQRKILFQSRNEVLSKNAFHELILRDGEAFLDDLLKEEKNEKNSFCQLEKRFDFYLVSEKKENFSKKKFYKEIWISADLKFAEWNCYQFNFLNQNRGSKLLGLIDFCWTEHLDRMSFIRDTINWRAYGQQNPLVEYNIEAFQSFQLMLEEIRSYMVYYSLNNRRY